MASAPIVSDSHPARRRMLALLATAELLGMSLWFAASAIARSCDRIVTWRRPF